jgi:hypothetical protein
MSLLEFYYLIAKFIRQLKQINNKKSFFEVKIKLIFQIINLNASQLSRYNIVHFGFNHFLYYEYYLNQLLLVL